MPSSDRLGRDAARSGDRSAGRGHRVPQREPRGAHILAAGQPDAMQQRIPAGRSDRGMDSLPEIVSIGLVEKLTDLGGRRVGVLWSPAPGLGDAGQVRFDVEFAEIALGCLELDSIRLQ